MPLQHGCEMLCNNQPAVVHVSLEFQLKNVVSQTRGEVELGVAMHWGPGARSSQSCVGVLDTIFLLWWHCSGTGGYRGCSWQPPAAVGPSGISACILRHKHRDGGTSERAPIRCPSTKMLSSEEH